MRSLLILSTLLTIDSQAINTLQNLYQQNYAIGSYNNSCVRISMFKFRATASGQATSLSLQFLQETQPLSGTLSLGLYNTVNSAQIGLTQALPYVTNQLGPQTYSLSYANWSFTSGTQYYISLQTPNYLRVPWATKTSSGATGPPVESITLQQAPTCNSTSWIALPTNPGAFIPILINITGPSPTVTPTHTPSQTQTTAPLVTSSSSTSTPSNTPSTTKSLDSTSTPTPTPTQTQTPTSSTTNSFGQTPYSSLSSSLSYSASPSYSQQLTQTLQATQTQTETQTQTILPNSLNQPVAISASTPTTPIMIGGYVFGFIGLTLLISYVVHYMTQLINRQAKSPLATPSIVVQNPADTVIPVLALSPLQSQQPQPSEQLKQTQELPKNQWHRVNDGEDIYYYNHVTKASEWFLPEDGIVIGEGVPGN